MAGARLTVYDREVIARGVRTGWSRARIAQAIGKHRTTVVREMARSSGLKAYSVPKGDPFHERRFWAARPLRGHGGAVTGGEAEQKIEGVQAVRRIHCGGRWLVTGELVTATSISDVADLVP